MKKSLAIAMLAVMFPVESHAQSLPSARLELYAGISNFNTSVIAAHDVISSITNSPHLISASYVSATAPCCGYAEYLVGLFQGKNSTYPIASVSVANTSGSQIDAGVSYIFQYYFSIVSPVNSAIYVPYGYFHNSASNGGFSGTANTFTRIYGSYGSSFLDIQVSSNSKYSTSGYLMLSTNQSYLVDMESWPSSRYHHDVGVTSIQQFSLDVDYIASLGYQISTSPGVRMGAIDYTATGSAVPEVSSWLCLLSGFWLVGCTYRFRLQIVRSGRSGRVAR